ncbi:unnamed protein product [Effrenium voratum]|uniref:Uncharacterized protein n=1 Tax=Effrenium voratum TaxID=2562239 RepID=A0AA36IES7_9DINO|nr:unnamed protein product [Effrenium voratum]CAJ1457695.1 unnamed protein product [Effrenium voratum]
MAGRVAPGGLIHTGGSVPDTSSDVEEAPGSNLSFPSLILGGHRAPVCAVAWLPGEKVLTGSHDQSAKVWNARTGVCEHTLQGHEGPIAAVAGDRAGLRVLPADHAGAWAAERVTGLGLLGFVAAGYGVSFANSCELTSSERICF